MFQSFLAQLSRTSRWALLGVSNKCVSRSTFDGDYSLDLCHKLFRGCDKHVSLNQVGVNRLWRKRIQTEKKRVDYQSLQHFFYRDQYFESVLDFCTEWLRWCLLYTSIPAVHVDWVRLTTSLGMHTIDGLNLDDSIASQKSGSQESVSSRQASLRSLFCLLDFLALQYWLRDELLLHDILLSRLGLGHAVLQNLRDRQRIPEYWESRKLNDAASLDLHDWKVYCEALAEILEAHFELND